MLTPAEERDQRPRVCFMFVFAQGAQCFHCSWPAIRLPGLPVVTLGSTIALFAGACREFERAFSIRPLLELGDTRTLMRVCVARVFVSCFAANFGEARCLQNFPNKLPPRTHRRPAMVRKVFAPSGEGATDDESMVESIPEESEFSQDQVAEDGPSARWQVPVFQGEWLCQDVQLVDSQLVCRSLGNRFSVIGH